MTTNNNNIRSHPNQKGVPLELFHFSRVIVDEFSYYLRKEEGLYQGRMKFQFFFFAIIGGGSHYLKK